tara:strand:+ start:896 stop:1081 length:186 start_codon:yes stop_codon:yes gene_type:complete
MGNRWVIKWGMQAREPVPDPTTDLSHEWPGQFNVFSPNVVINWTTSNVLPKDLLQLGFRHV